MAFEGIMTGLIWAFAAGGAGAVHVDVCVEPSFEAAVAVMRLGRHSPGLDLRPVRPERCDDGAGYRARFTERGGRVTLVLSTPTGDRLERAVPWATRSEDALIDVARRGRLGGLAVLLGGLMLEDRAVASAERRSPPMASERLSFARPGVRSDSPVVPQASPEPPSLAPPAPPSPGRDTRPALESTPRDDAPAPSRPVRARRAPTPRIASTAAQALARAGPERALDLRPPPPPEPAPFPDAAPALPANGAPDGRTGAAGRSSEPGGRVESGGPGIASDTSPAPTSGRVRSEADPHIGLEVGAALRAPSVLGLEAALRIEAWDVSLEVGALPPLVWELDGRPLELSSAWMALGWSLPVWRTASLEVDGRISGVIERLTVLRLELPDAMTRAVWDAGLDASVAAMGPMGDGWRIGGRLGLRWLATANDVRIPEGPRAALNVWQCRLGLVVDWAP